MAKYDDAYGYLWYLFGIHKVKELSERKFIFVLFKKYFGTFP